MDIDIFIALINPAAALIFAAAFALLWRHERQRRYIAMLAGAFFCLGLGFLFQHVQPLGPTASRLLSNVFFLAGGSGIVLGVLDRYRRNPPYGAIALCAGVGFLSFLYFLLVQPDLNWRIYVINFTFGALSLALAAELRDVRARKPVDNVLLGIILFLGISFFPRPIIVMWLDGPYERTADLHETLYWVTLVFSAWLFLLILALTLITAIVLDVMDELRHESHTDALSGLLNRRGFEDGAAALLQQARRRHMPAALVICDLDHFKSINDGYGHGCGDGVITAFADCLTQCVGGTHLVGRIGGEEFAILMLGANVSTGRLFAEGARSAFSCLAIAGLPDQMRCTASFGVAEWREGEDITGLFARADQALYDAKEAGRDCVRTSRTGHAPAGRAADGRAFGLIGNG